MEGARFEASRDYRYGRFTGSTETDDLTKVLYSWLFISNVMRYSAGRRLPEVHSAYPRELRQGTGRCGGGDRTNIHFHRGTVATAGTLARNTSLPHSFQRSSSFWDNSARQPVLTTTPYGTFSSPNTS